MWPHRVNQMNMLQWPQIYLQGGDRNFEILMGQGNKISQPPGRLHQAEGCVTAFYLSLLCFCTLAPEKSVSLQLLKEGDLVPERWLIAPAPRLSLRSIWGNCSHLEDELIIAIVLWNSNCLKGVLIPCHKGAHQSCPPQNPRSFLSSPGYKVNAAGSAWAGKKEEKETETNRSDLSQWLSFLLYIFLPHNCSSLTWRDIKMKDFRFP